MQIGWHHRPDGVCGHRRVGKMSVTNMLERPLMDCSWASPNWPNGPIGAGLARASARAWAATTAASADEFISIGKEVGKTFTVFANAF